MTLTVASGRADLDVEDVTGEPYDQAARDLVALGLVPSRADRTQAEGAGGRRGRPPDRPAAAGHRGHPDRGGRAGVTRLRPGRAARASADATR